MKTNTKAAVIMIVIILLIDGLGIIIGHIWHIYAFIAMYLVWAWGRGNIILQKKPSKYSTELKLDEVNRFEVIDDSGRVFVKHMHANDVLVEGQLQDNNTTLKIFLKHSKQEGGNL